MKNLKQVILLSVIVVGLSGCAAAVVTGVVVGASTAHDRRTAGTVVDDQRIELQAFDRLRKDDGPAHDNHIKTISYNQLVLLAGEVETEQDKQRAEDIVSEIDKVRGVVNELKIRDKTGIIRRGRDSFLTSRVKTRMFGIEGLDDFDPTRVKVVSVDGDVFLLGLVTQEEADVVAERVSRVRGVKRVVKVFEYIAE